MSWPRGSSLCLFITHAEQQPVCCRTGRLDLRVGHILKVSHHPTADKLFCLLIDVGDSALRHVASGLRSVYTSDQLQGRQVIVVCNLKPRTLVRCACSMFFLHDKFLRE